MLWCSLASDELQAEYSNVQVAWNNVRGRVASIREGQTERLALLLVIWKAAEALVSRYDVGCSVEKRGRYQCRNFIRVQDGRACDAALWSSNG